MSPRFPSPVIDQMLVRGQITRVAPNRAQSDQLLAQAEAHLRSAQTLRYVDTAGAFVLAYDAARKALTAILLNQGRKPRGEGAHALGQFTGKPSGRAHPTQPDQNGDISSSTRWARSRTAATLGTSPVMSSGVSSGASASGGTGPTSPRQRAVQGLLTMGAVVPGGDRSRAYRISSTRARCRQSMAGCPGDVDKRTDLSRQIPKAERPLRTALGARL